MIVMEILSEISWKICFSSEQNMRSKFRILSTITKIPLTKGHALWKKKRRIAVHKLKKALIFQIERGIQK